MGNNVYVNFSLLNAKYFLCKILIYSLRFPISLLFSMISSAYFKRSDLVTCVLIIFLNKAGDILSLLVTLSNWIFSSVSTNNTLSKYFTDFVSIRSGTITKQYG